MDSQEFPVALWPAAGDGALDRDGRVWCHWPTWGTQLSLLPFVGRWWNEYYRLL